MKKIILIVTLLLLTLSACDSQAEETTSPDIPSGDAVKIQLGETIFQANCSACHETKSKDTLVGPTMISLAERAGSTVSGMTAKAYIEESILDPAAYLNEGFSNMMPATYGTSLTDEQFDALVTFLMTFE